MVTQKKSHSGLRSLFLICFAILVILAAAYGITLAFVYLASGAPTAGVCVWLLMIASLFLYFRWPWTSAIVSWIEIARAFHQAMAWEIKSLGFLSALNVTFLLAAHVGVLSYVLMKREKKQGEQCA